MRYSFIEPRPKTAVSPAVRRVWTVTALLLAVLAGASYYLHLENTRLRAELAEENEVHKSLALQTGQLQAQLERMQRYREQAEKVDTGNQLLAERVRDLLDLVPDDTVLERFELTADGVLIGGTTRNAGSVETLFVKALSGEYVLKTFRHSVTGDGGERFILEFVRKGTAS